MDPQHKTVSVNKAEAHVEHHKQNSRMDKSESTSTPSQKKRRVEAPHHTPPRPSPAAPQKPWRHGNKVERSGQPVTAAPTSRLHHPFKANFNDHFETSTEALKDVLPFVNELRQLLRPSTPERLTLYDPYYCSGTIVLAWKRLGVEHVLHENRDFYADVAQGTVPGPYDILVTNPPFSDDHIWRLLDFLVTQTPLKPWAFVAPDYIASKPQYRAWVQRYFTPTTTASSSALVGAGRRAPPAIPSIESILPPFLLPPEATTTSAESNTANASSHIEDEKEKEDGGKPCAPSSSKPSTTAVPTAAAVAARPVPVGPEPFYIVPRVRYDYAHPLGVGHDHSHFKSMWYVWAGRHTSEVLRGVSVALSGRGRNTTTTRSSTTAAAPSPVAVVGGYQVLLDGHYVSATDRRPNPERRQRAVSGGGRSDSSRRPAPLFRGRR
jgi:hypothetical protein